MATKAAKSITINATKYELANTLAVSDGKIQLKAKDVVLDEVEVASDFVIDLTDGQEMFDIASTTWSCTSFAYADLQAAIAAGKRIVIRSKNYLDNDNPTSNKMYLTPTEVRDSVGGSQVIMFIPHGSYWYSIGIAQTTNVTSLNVNKNDI